MRESSPVLMWQVGMTMPPEIIVEEIERSLALKGKKELIHG
jgi:pyruvate ferredoxin oxidoreductase alpha subunit